MEESKKVYFCKSCGKDDSEVSFYAYLHTRCMLCKRKSVKDSKDNKNKEVREEKINTIDPEEKIRYLWSEMMKEPFYRNGKKSILDFMEETDQDISDLVLGLGDLKIDCFKGIESQSEKILPITKFIKNIDTFIDSRVELAITNFKKELFEKYEIKEKALN